MTQIEQLEEEIKQTREKLAVLECEFIKKIKQIPDNIRWGQVYSIQIEGHTYKAVLARNPCDHSPEGSFVILHAPDLNCFSVFDKPVSSKTIRSVLLTAHAEYEGEIKIEVK